MKAALCLLQRKWLWGRMQKWFASTSHTSLQSINDAICNWITLKDNVLHRHMWLVKWAKAFRLSHLRGFPGKCAVQRCAVFFIIKRIICRHSLCVWCVLYKSTLCSWRKGSAFHIPARQELVWKPMFLVAAITWSDQRAASVSWCISVPLANLK